MKNLQYDVKDNANSEHCHYAASWLLVFLYVRFHFMIYFRQLGVFI